MKDLNSINELDESFKVEETSENVDPAFALPIGGAFKVEETSENVDPAFALPIGGAF